MARTDREIVLSAARHIEDCGTRISDAIEEEDEAQRDVQFQGIVDTLELHAGNLRRLASNSPAPGEVVETFRTPEAAATAARHAAAYIRKANDTPILEENISTLEKITNTLRAGMTTTSSS